MSFKILDLFPNIVSIANCNYSSSMRFFTSPEKEAQTEVSYGHQIIFCALYSYNHLYYYYLRNTNLLGRLPKFIFENFVKNVFYFLT